MTVSMDKEGARAGGSAVEKPTVQEDGASPDRQGDVRTQLIAVGASAGGLDGLRRLLGALPKDANVAVVVIQHLSPTHESLLTAALHAVSPLRVVEVQDGMRVAAGQVHVIPPNTALVLEGDRLRVHRRDEFANPLMPIDTFMRSLAAERKARAVGVVLSGTGSDGTQGLKAIRAAGGRTYAQEPSTAVHDGMPRSAIAANAVDLILAPEVIAADLAALARGAPAPSDREETRADDDSVFRQARYQQVNDPSNDLQNLVTSADIPIVIVDRERRVRRFTPRARSSFNLLPADLGRAIAEIRPNVDAPELDAWISEVIETATVREVEVRDRDGRWQRLQIRPYQTADKRIDGAVVSLVDIDALKSALTEVGRARDFAAATLETVPLPVVVLDEALRVASANDAFYEAFRASPAATMGRPLLPLDEGPCGNADLARRLRDALERGLPFQDLELECDLPEDGHRTVVMSGRVIPEAPGGSRSLVVAIQDVTERRRIEEDRARARTEEAQRFLNEAGAAMLPESLDHEATLATVAHLVVPRHADWCIIDLVEAGGAIRQAAAAHVDPAKEQRARALRRRFPPEAQPERGVAWVIRTGKPVLFPELEDIEWLAGALGAEHPEFLRELGARSYLSVPLRGRKGVIGAMSLVRGLPGRRYGPEDVALAEGLGQRAGLAVENARLYVAAREAIVARDDFLAIAAHELRTPLSTLNLQLQTLGAARGAQLVEAVAAGKLERAIKQTRRLADLIDSLLEVSRITAGRLTLHRETTDLSGLAHDVAQRLRGASDAAGCTVTVNAPEPVTGPWDPLRLDQVVSNLLQNAIRYAPGSLVELSVEGNAWRARLAVRDHGPGIPAERRARIFERFEKGGARSQEGLGLGLYITHQIVEAHGGAIRIESEAGAGTTFIVELPRSVDPAGGAAA